MSGTFLCAAHNCKLSPCTLALSISFSCNTFVFPQCNNGRIASALFTKLPEPKTKTTQTYFSACGAFKQTQKETPPTPPSLTCEYCNCNCNGNGSTRGKVLLLWHCKRLLKVLFLLLYIWFSCIESCRRKSLKYAAILTFKLRPLWTVVKAVKIICNISQGCNGNSANFT